MCNKEQDDSADSDPCISPNLPKFGLKYPSVLNLLHIPAGLNNQVFNEFQCIPKSVVL